MTPETPFRIALLLIIVTTAGVAAYHRWHAAKSGERISHREEGYVFAIVLRLSGLGLWIATFAYLVFPSSVAWIALPLPPWLRWTAVVVGSACPFLMYWTLSHLGRNLTDTVVTRSNATLVTEGPYRWVRHPFYVTTALVMTAVTIISGNLAIGATSLIILTMLAVRTSKEEQKLLDRFGDEYRDYMRHTGRFIPLRRRPG